MFKKLGFLITTILVSLQTCVFAFAKPDPLERLRDEMQSSTAQEIGWGILAPAVKIIAIVFFVLGITAIIVAVGYLLIRGIKMLFGKGSLGKTEIGKAFSVLVIGVLVSGGSWIGVVSLGNKVIVKPVSDEIIEKDTGENQNSSNNQNVEEQSSGDKKDTNLEE